MSSTPSQTVANPLTLTAGAGRSHPKGRRLVLPTDAALLTLAGALKEPWAHAEEAWLSLHSYAGDYRSKYTWNGAAGIGVDVDYHDFAGRHAPVAPKVAFQAMATVDLGNLLHDTPRGFRVILLFDGMVTDATRWIRLASGLGQRINEGLGKAGLLAPLNENGSATGLGFAVDRPALLDRARLLFTPCAQVDGVQRKPVFQILREDPCHV